MAKRISLDDTSEEASPKGGAYFTSRNTSVEFIPTGCKVLDLILGGGWAEGRVANIIGDKATGKTLLAIEAAANFIRKYPKGLIRYRETEDAFDEPYAEALGLPLDRCDFGDPIDTVEDMFKDTAECLKKSMPQLYIVDSLDALSDDAELERNFGEATYGAGKAKMLSEYFRRIIRDMRKANMTMIIISQIRDNLNAGQFGKKYKRSGGRALDFYASQVATLTNMGVMSKTINKIKRPIGLQVHVKMEKNKVGLPYRGTDFDIHFGYGVDDRDSCLKFLKGIKPEWAKQYADASMPELHDIVTREWYRIEQGFVREERKYG